MDDWSVAICAVVVGGGTLAFLKIVSNEVVFQLRALELRARADQEEKEREKTRREKENPEVVEAQAAEQVLLPDDNVEAA